MLSKNNRRLQEQKVQPQKARFGLRKLSVGVASVLLGFTFLYGGTQTVHADTNDSVVTTSSEVVSNTNDASSSLTGEAANQAASPEVATENPTNSPATTNGSSTNVSNSTATQPANSTTAVANHTLSTDFAKVDPTLLGANIIPLDSDQVNQVVANIKKANPWLNDDDIKVNLDGSATVNVDGQEVSLNPRQTVAYHGGDFLPQKLPQPKKGYQYVLTATQDSPAHGHEILHIVADYLPGYRADPDIDGNTTIQVNVTLEASPQKTTIEYVDDDTNGKQVNVVTLNGKTAQTVTPSYDIPMNYDYVSGKIGSYTFKPENNDPIVIHLKHHTNQVTDSKDVTETIQYHYANGDQAAPDYNTTVTLTRTGVKDAVTGQTTWQDWSTNQFAAVKSPVITGYTPDITTVDAIDVDGDSVDTTKTVTYTKDAVKTPDQSNPTDTAKHHGNGTATTLNDDNVTPVAHSTGATRQANHELPQTGAGNDRSLLALGMVAALSSLGLAGLASRKHN